MTRADLATITETIYAAAFAADAARAEAARLYNEAVQAGSDGASALAAFRDADLVARAAWIAADAAMLAR